MAFFAQAFGPVRARGIYLGGSTARVPLFAVCRSRIAFFALFLLVTLPTFLFSPYRARRKWLQNYEKLRVQVAQLGRDRGTVPAVLG